MRLNCAARPGESCRSMSSSGVCETYRPQRRRRARSMAAWCSSGVRRRSASSAAAESGSSGRWNRTAGSAVSSISRLAGSIAPTIDGASDSEPGSRPERGLPSPAPAPAPARLDRWGQIAQMRDSRRSGAQRVSGNRERGPGQSTRPSCRSDWRSIGLWVIWVALMTQTSGPWGRPSRTASTK